MSFIEDVKNLFGPSEFPESPEFRAVIFGERAVYLEGIKSIKEYSEEKIELSVKRGTVTVSGEKLYVKRYCMGDMAICGKIKSLTRN